MPSSPQTPRHSRTSSAFDSYSGSPQDRRLSKSSMPDPSTPFRNSFNQADGLDMSVLGSGGDGAGNGMGNLADELADAFSDSGEEDEYDDGDLDGEPAGPGNEHLGDVSGTGDVGSPSESEGDKSKSMTLGLPSPRRGHQRQKSDYDGSEYGSETDLETPGMPPGLVAKMDAVESLARRGTENYGGPADDVFKRVTNGLRDLGSQSSVDNGTLGIDDPRQSSNSATTQLDIRSFITSCPPPDEETVDELVPLLVSLTDSMPQPSTSAFNSLTALHTITSDLVQTLNYLSDTLHMSRQTTTMATRRLKSAKEIVAEMRREEELREEGERWLTRGNWGERLEKRECAGVCGEVIGGFEEVCNGWRERLLAQAESQA